MAKASMDTSLGNYETKNRGSFMNGPLISVIVPAYNYGHLIAEALASVSAQVYTNWECIVVDDGSTDHTGAVVQNYIKQHSEQNFRYIYKSNSGLSATRNVGIEQANGLYLQFLDADDLLSENKFSSQVPLMEMEDCALVFSKSLFFNDKDGDLISVIKYPSGYLANETLLGFKLLNWIIKNNIFPVSSPLLHSALVEKAGKFESGLNSNEDWLFWFNIALLKPRFVYDNIESSFTKIRVHDKSMMNNHQRMFLSEVAVRQKMEDKLSTYFDIPNVGQLRKSNVDLLALHRIRSLELGIGMKYVLTHFVRQPLQNFQLLCKGCFKMMVRLYKK